MIDECGISFLHVFPYSPRDGTPAARMPQLDRGLIKNRAARLRAKGDVAHDAHLDAMVASAATHSALVEYSGVARTENFTPVVAQNAPRGQMALIKVTGRDKDQLIGDLVDAAAEDTGSAVVATG
jgi:threonylcarbamoyladenosine tRNA methylthiotransferase MtaB